MSPIGRGMQVARVNVNRRPILGTDPRPPADVQHHREWQRDRQVRREPVQMLRLHRAPNGSIVDRAPVRGAQHNRRPDRRAKRLQTVHKPLLGIVDLTVRTPKLTRRKMRTRRAHRLDLLGIPERLNDDESRGTDPADLGRATIDRNSAAAAPARCGARETGVRRAAFASALATERPRAAVT